MASNLMSVAALGRPFTPGMLYDARSDTLIPGLTLWDDATLQGKISSSAQTSSEFAISTSDTVESKSSLLNVETSLKASFLSGLVEIGGSAKYLKDDKKFKNQSRVTCQYKATTNFKQLSMVDLLTLTPNQIDVIQKTSATHVVTGILYGANAFFVFDSEKLEATNVQKVEVGMKAVINKIPTFNLEASVDVQLNDEEKKLTQQFSCKFYGDFILETNPSTYAEAVRAYGDLPGRLGEHGKNAVPVKVWLMPLKQMYPDADGLTTVISDGLVRKIQDTLENLREMQMRCNDAVEDGVIKNFSYLHEEMSTFQKLCYSYMSNLRRAMEKKIPAIRDGQEDESSLAQLFDDRATSPFNETRMTTWMDHKEREINIIRSCVDIMKGAKMVRNQSELDQEILAGGVQDVLVYVFTSMKRGDAYLDELAVHLGHPTSGSTAEDQWYYNNDVLTKMKAKAKAFHDLTRAQNRSNTKRFLIRALTNEGHPGATIYHYRNGILVTENFSKPDVAPHEITDRRDLLWHATDLTLDPNTANNYLYLSDGNKRATSGKTWNYYHDNPNRFDTHTQVLCTEGLSGRHYWEVEWSHYNTEHLSIVGAAMIQNMFKRSIYAAVAYKGIDRKGSGNEASFGNNPISWAFGRYADNSFELRAWHNGLVWKIPCFEEYSKIGVYLDWAAGTLSFYKVSSHTLTHLYTFITTFTEPVYPGFWVYNTENYIYLHPFE